jgi:malate synthase
VNFENALQTLISGKAFQKWFKSFTDLRVGNAGMRVTRELFARVLDEELVRIEKEVGAAKFASGKYKEAAVLFAKQCTAPVLDDFLTLDAYRYIVTHAPSARM